MDEHIFVIAEAGVNHNGDIDLAFKLVEEAAKAKADAVKFQTFIPENVISRNAQKAAYQKVTTGVEESQLDMVRKFYLDKESFRSIAEQCKRHHILFLSTPFDLDSIDTLVNLNLRTFKIPSGEITNLPYLRKIGALGGEIILSTGMSTLEEVAVALNVLETSGTPRSRITLLHCTTEYPAPFESVNLRAMQTMREAFPGIAGVGYSDHTPGIAIPIAAAAMGATIIEKHFTLDKNLPGPDHKASLEPDELAAMVAGIRQVEQAMGDGVKAPSPAEIPNMAVARKSLVAACAIRKGEVFTSANVACKRPGNGLSPMKWDSIMGLRAERDYNIDELLVLKTKF